MKLYAFASNNLTNIWAGVGAGMWAVAPSDNASFAKGRTTKARRMPIGAFGILYCKATQSFTVPFVVYSEVRDGIVGDVWPEDWTLPFSIKPLGSPRKQLTRAAARMALPSVVKSKITLEKLIPVSATTAFSPSDITDADWAFLIRELAD